MEIKMMPDAPRIIDEIRAYSRGGLWIKMPPDEAAELLDHITAQAEEIERLNELTSCSVTVGRGLSVYGTIEAVGRVQTYILLDSNHPVEKADVRRTLARELQAAEARVRELEGEAEAPVQDVEVPPMPPTVDRRPFISAAGSHLEGYFESDNDWADENYEAITWLADNHAAIRAALAATGAALEFDDEVIAYAQEIVDDREANGCKVYVSDVIDALRAALEASHE